MSMTRNMRGSRTKAWLHRRLPVEVHRLRSRLRGSHWTPPVGKVRLGDLSCVTPISADWGYGRGGPIDRVYIERFLRQYSADVQGRVLEIGDKGYIEMIGGCKVSSAEVLHIDPSVPGVTYVGDLASDSVLPADYFDCIILTQTLHFIFDFPAALRSLERALKPGGILLLTTPGISNIGDGVWDATWHYSFSANALKVMFTEIFPADSMEIHSYGNVLASIAFLHGLTLDDLDASALDHEDPRYALINAARVVKRMSL